MADHLSAMDSVISPLIPDSMKLLIVTLIPNSIIQSHPSLTVLILIVTTLIILLYLYIAARPSRPPVILLTGLSDSGKTTLFHSLRYINKGVNVPKIATVTSMKENDSIIRLGRQKESTGLPSSEQKSSKEIRLVDLPGHPQLRFKLSSYLTQARAVIFLIDSSSFLQSSHAVSDLLCSILRHPQVGNLKSKVKILVVCTKVDMPFSMEISKLKNLLEMEVTKVERTRELGIKDLDEGKNGDHVSLLQDGKDFRFDDMRGKVEWVSIDATKNSGSESVRKWIEKL
ncbi:signal recognition particle receptor beta subunit-domain-containing protein [Paraphysoderma sedebokerense]|nr:signal recognition particle receptor beta subunit-domain-containing protein [Paraphysoderma sedebokerense]